MQITQLRHLVTIMCHIVMHILQRYEILLISPRPSDGLLSVMDGLIGSGDPRDLPALTPGSEGIRSTSGP